jgi:hypothetical protein
MAHPPVAPQSFFRRRNRWPIFTADADRSSSVFFTQQNSEAASHDSWLPESRGKRQNCLAGFPTMRAAG